MIIGTVLDFIRLTDVPMIIGIRYRILFLVFEIENSDRLGLLFGSEMPESRLNLITMINYILKKIPENGLWLSRNSGSNVPII